MKMIQLPNGNWIAPGSVQHIESAAKSEDRPDVKNRVTIRIADFWEVIEFKTKESADLYRDRLAAAVNAELKKQ